jgi:NitT/TauT family transport system permease protein
MALLFFGNGDKPAIVLIFLAATWPLLINTFFGVRSIEQTLIKVARAARASELLIFRDIILPSAMPAVFTGLPRYRRRLLTVVTAEMIAVKSGLGYMILNAQLTFRRELIVAGDAGYRSLCRPESASVAKNAHPRLGPRQTL